MTAGSNVKTTVYTYNEQSRLTSSEETLSGGTVKTTYYYYDSNGNLVSDHVETIENATGLSAVVNLFLSGDSESELES